MAISIESSQIRRNHIRLKSLNFFFGQALKAFEATVRLRSVRAAAQELHVVHGAVSQQIRSLEEMLGMELFERKGRRLLLTQHGQRYSDAINVAFGVIERAGDEMRPAGSARVFRLGMRSAFAAYWFLPRLNGAVVPYEPRDRPIALGDSALPANLRNCRGFSNPGSSCQSGATGWWS